MYERWSRHPDLDKFERILESWDDRVCSEWIAPDSKFLNCDDWLIDNSLYRERNEMIHHYVKVAFDKVKIFFEQFEPILVNYWENMRTNYKIFNEENLQNPAEVLKAMIYRFKYQRDFFDAVLPTSREIGMVKIDLRKIKQKMVPQPKICLDKLKAIVPKVV